MCVLACAHLLGARVNAGENMPCGKAFLKTPVDCAAGMFKKQNDERRALQKEREDEGIF